MEECFSGVVQISAWKACLTDDPSKEMDTLESLYLKSVRIPAEVARSPRQVIYSAMEEAFQSANVWASMEHGIDLAPYTWKTDSRKIDCGYRVGGSVQMFQAVPLLPGPEGALAMAIRYPAMVKSMGKMEHSSVALTVVTEDGLDPAESHIELARDALRRTGIVEATVSDLAGIAERARMALRV
jgi:hypothetical protein